MHDPVEAFAKMQELLEQQKETLELLIKRREHLGEYNADAADILAIARIERMLVIAMATTVSSLRTLAESIDRK